MPKFGGRKEVQSHLSSPLRLRYIYPAVLFVVGLVIPAEQFFVESADKIDVCIGAWGALECIGAIGELPGAEKGRRDLLEGGAVLQRVYQPLPAGLVGLP